MKRIGYYFLAVAAAVTVAGAAHATPNANGAAINQYVFGDCPFSTLSVTNSYPALLNINDQVAANSCGGFANLHAWSFSSDGGATAAVFDNNSCFSFGCDLVITGDTQVEAGLRISPWYGKYSDGRLNVRIPDGEIAAFGGRMPFRTWTAAIGPPNNEWGTTLHYAAGDPIHLEMHYDPNSLSSSDPATVQYVVVYGGNTYMSSQIPLDMGNPTEDPPYGLWGMLNDGRVGGYMQMNQGTSPISQAKTANALFTNIQYTTCSKPTPTNMSSWGRIKTLYR
jgi:hypothetical protein